MKRSQLFCGMGSMAGMLILILDGKTALLGAREGLALCIQSLIPSLFPFFVLSSVLTTAFTGTSLPMLRPIGKLLGIPAGCEALLIPAYLGGYPAGARSIGEACRQKQLSPENAQRLLLFCNNCGPSFLFGILGSIFPKQWMLWVLWGIQLVGSVFIARLFPAHPETGEMRSNPKSSVADSLTSSVSVMGAVCGWVILFRILMTFLEKWVLWRFPVAIQVFFMGFLELSNGCCALAAVADLRLRFLLACGMLSFGGICVTMQTASAIGGLPIRGYLMAKGLQALFAFSIVAAFLYHMPVLLVAIILCGCFLKKVVAKPRVIVYNDGINQRRNPYAVS